MCTHVYHSMRRTYSRSGPTCSLLHASLADLTNSIRPSRHMYKVLGRFWVLDQKENFTLALVFDQIFPSITSSNTFQCCIWQGTRYFLFLCSNHRRPEVLAYCIYMEAIALDQLKWAHQRLLWRSMSILPLIPITSNGLFYLQSSLSNTNPHPRNPCISLPYLQKIQNASISLGWSCCYFGFDFRFDLFPYALA